jgi:hypothetical protein
MKSVPFITGFSRRASHVLAPAILHAPSKLRPILVLVAASIRLIVLLSEMRRPVSEKPVSQDLKRSGEVECFGVV